jgi:hypothetical protein
VTPPHVSDGAGHAVTTPPEYSRYVNVGGLESTRVNIGFTDKGPSKSTVALAHERLADADEAPKRRKLCGSNDWSSSPCWSRER